MSLILVWTAGLMLAMLQANPPPGCNGPEHDDFDFWVGEWNVYAPDGGPYQGRNIIAREEGGCLISENWTGAQGSTGQSMNMFDPLIGQWRQVWVSPGVFIDYTGGLNEDGAMEMSGEIFYISRGTRTPFRGVWTPQQDGTVRQHFQQHDENGEWSDWFVGIYVREADDPRAAEARAARSE